MTNHTLVTVLPDTDDTIVARHTSTGSIRLGVGSADVVLTVEQAERVIAELSRAVSGDHDNAGSAR